jgi:hypothetical protein
VNRVRDVGRYGHCTWVLELEAGGVEIVVRRHRDGARWGHEERFAGATEEEAAAKWEAWGLEQAAKVVRTAERRAKWGPDELRP